MGLQTSHANMLSVWLSRFGSLLSNLDSKNNNFTLPELKKLLRTSAFVFSDPKNRSLESLKESLNDLEYGLRVIEAKISKVDSKIEERARMYCWLIIL